MKRTIPALVAVAALALPGIAKADTAPTLVFPEDTNGVIYVHTGQSVQMPVRLAFAQDAMTPGFDVSRIDGTPDNFACSGNANGSQVSWDQHVGFIPEPTTILCGTLPSMSAGASVTLSLTSGVDSHNQQDLLETNDLTASNAGGNANYMYVTNNFTGVQVTVNRWVTNSAGSTVRRMPVTTYSYLAGTFAVFKWNYRNNHTARVKPGTYHMHVSFNSAVETSNTINRKVKVS